MLTFRFDFSYQYQKRAIIHQTQNSTLYRVLNISTLYPVNIIGYGVVL